MLLRTADDHRTGHGLPPFAHDLILTWAARWNPPDAHGLAASRNRRTRIRPVRGRAVAGLRRGSVPLDPRSLAPLARGCRPHSTSRSCFPRSRLRRDTARTTRPDRPACKAWRTGDTPRPSPGRTRSSSRRTRGSRRQSRTFCSVRSRTLSAGSSVAPYWSANSGWGPSSVKKPLGIQPPDETPNVLAARHPA